MTSTFRSTAARRNRVAAGALAAATLLLAACSGPGGPRYSGDRYTYHSTSWAPKTVTNIDTRTGEPGCAGDVPVGDKLVIAFSEGTGPNEYRPDEIVWGVARIEDRIRTHKRQPCPRAAERRIEMALRAVPELEGVEPPASVEPAGG